ncbi:adipokinetic hormone/corazonin-related peptide receptor variant I isoform X2 [Anabrus simplex]|uniref:adipokinetic hormone/corazonin-related peptide receptor variant I isoform X2 n=1 Tax=Anabrus simplex TaxID=316456 RepID=UPI0034DD6BE0
MEVQSPWSSTNSTSGMTDDMRFTSTNVVSIACYSVFFIVSAFGNCTVLSLILRRRTRSRLTTMLMHLAIADLLVTFLMMPLEIVWSATVSWWAGDAMCRIMAFFRMFGLFLSSFVLICISVDRYFAVLRPMSLRDIASRSRFMLYGAWFFSFLCSLPQTVVFHVETHPEVENYTQCVTYHIFPSENTMMLYVLSGNLILYALPLIVIIFTYGSIIAEIMRRSGDDVFRRSSLDFLSRAKKRTLKMTITIVVVFFVCWTPYFVMSLWWWVDRKSATAMDPRIQKFLFIFACANSCMNPIVYGIYNIRPLHTRQQNRRYHHGTIRNAAHGHASKVICLVRWKKAPLHQDVCLNCKVTVSVGPVEASKVSS